MKKSILKTIVGLTFLCSTINVCIAQDTTQAKSKVGGGANNTIKHVITKNDGTEYIGVILKDDGREVLIETDKLGKIYLPKSDVKSIVKIEDPKEIVNGEYQPEGPFTTRYAFTNNALPIKKGENYTMVNLYGPEVHFAVTKNFNLGVMTTWIASPLILAMKYTFKTKESKVNFSIGTLLGTTGYLNQFRGYGGLHWLSMTLGSRNNNITFSGGYGYLKTGIRNYEDMEEGEYINNDGYYYESARKIKPMIQGPVASVAGIFKIGAKASFVFDSMCFLYETESNEVQTTQISAGSGSPNNLPYVPPVYKHVVTKKINETVGLFIMPGVRFQKTDRKAFQFSLAGVSIFGQRNVSFPIPMCSWFNKF